MDRKLLVVLEHDEETRQPRLDPRLARRLRDKSARDWRPTARCRPAPWPARLATWIAVLWGLGALAP